MIATVNSFPTLMRTSSVDSAVEYNSINPKFRSWRLNRLMWEILPISLNECEVYSLFLSNLCVGFLSKSKKSLTSGFGSKTYFHIRIQNIKTKPPTNVIDEIEYNISLDIMMQVGEPSQSLDSASIFLTFSICFGLPIKSQPQSLLQLRYSNFFSFSSRSFSGWVEVG